MGRRGRPSPHQAAEVGSVRIPLYEKGKLVGHRTVFFARCKCAWECGTNRGTRARAAEDHKGIHLADLKAAV